MSNRIPGPILVLVLGTAAVVIFKLPVETIGSRFGGIPSGLPHLEIPRFRSDLIHGCSAQRSRWPCWARSSR